MFSERVRSLVEEVARQDPDFAQRLARAQGEDLTRIYTDASERLRSYEWCARNLRLQCPVVRVEDD